MPESLSSQTQVEIEAAFKRPMVELQRCKGKSAVLDAVTAIHGRLALADRSVQFQARHLRKFLAPERGIGDSDVSHILDCAQRMAQAHSARTAHAAALTALLGIRQSPIQDSTPASRAPAQARTAPPTR
ncbi:hypothetical protein ACFY0R_09980 [Streptomyces sp. NPDC001633]|uniref:hypothetical protein n=1 Tax=Streptomyces sp. NPDC001633 TaxID=3364595 RepID=UPI0036D13CEC